MRRGTGAGTDPISGLPNRQQFLEDRTAAPDGPAAVALVTLADARAFNEILRALGHARSEAFIAAGAERLCQLIGPLATIYHVSVLSFAAVLPLVCDGARPAIVERIRRGFGRPLLCDDIPIDTRVGIGLAALSGTAGGGPKTCALPSPPRRTAAAGPRAGHSTTRAATPRTAARSGC